jgi:DNA polymerase I-like protein with 3'-5' exonuclease and polymerase domains
MVIRDIGDIEKVQNFISQNEFIAFDIETTGLQPRTDKVIGFGVSNGVEGFYVVHYEWIDNELVEVVPYNVCREILELLKHRKWTGWNSSFEVRFIRHYFNVELINSLWSEGMLAKHTVDEERPFRLKEVAAKVYGSSATEEQKLMKESIKANGGNPTCDYYMADADIMGAYCIQDCLLTFRLNEKYLAEIEEQGLTDFYFKDEVMPLYNGVTIEMEDRGVKLDIDLMLSTKDEITVDIDTLHDKLQLTLSPMLDLFEQWYLNKELKPKRTGEFAQYICKFANLELPLTKSGKFSIAKAGVEALEDSIYKQFFLGGDYLPVETVQAIQRLWWEDQDQKYMFNLSSKDHLKRLFFEKLGETPVSKTKLGNPQVDNLFLDNMEKKYDWVRELQNYNKLNKLKSTYMDRFLEKQLEGVFYPSFFQHRTISGRYGSDLQQLPRPKEDGELDEVVLKYSNLIRKFFVARTDNVFIDADYESLEPHVFAHVSNDEGLRDIFRNGHDFYSTIAIGTESLKGVSADKKADNYLGSVDKVKRQTAKAYSLGVPYGMGAYALSKSIDVNQKDAERLIDNYLNAFPNLKAWMVESKEDCVTKGMVRSEAGRIRHMPKAPKIWFSHGEELLDSLKLWKKYHDCPKKYSQMKFLRKEMSNYINNSRNFQIQSLAASITNRACIAINKELKRQGIKGSVSAQIHDQIIVEVPAKYAEKCRKMVQFIMENTYKLSLKLKAPAEIGVDFYDAH